MAKVKGFLVWVLFLAVIPAIYMAALFYMAVGNDGAPTLTPQPIHLAQQTQGIRR